MESQSQEEEADAVKQLLDDAVNASRTLLLEENLLHTGVYVLHGDADNNVPVSQARFMRDVDFARSFDVEEMRPLLTKS